MKGQMGRDARLEVRTLDKRRHRTQGEAVPEKLGEPQVPGERRTWSTVTGCAWTSNAAQQEQIQRKKELVMGLGTYLHLVHFYSEVDVNLGWLLSAAVPFGSGSAPGVHRVAFSLFWKEPGLCTVGLLQADESALTRVVGRFAAKALSLSGLKY